MRHPSLILAATLIFSQGAYAIVPPKPKPAPAPATGPVPFNPADWQVLSGADAAAANCAGGFLASKKSEVASKTSSFGTIIGYNTSIPVYCVKLDVPSGNATITPVDPKVADLSVYSPGTMTPTFAINRGKNGKDVSLRAPSDAELKPAVSADGRFAPLTSDERYWLDQTALTAYDKTAGEHPAADALLTLEKETRHAVAVHLPSFARAGYEALAKAPLDPNKISGYLDRLIAIRDAAELQKLGEIKKGEGVGIHLQKATALEEYNGAMAAVKLGADKRPLPGPARDGAVEIVNRFRGMLEGKTGAPKKRPGTQRSGDRSAVVLNLSADEMNWLTPTERTAYIARGKVVLKESTADKIQFYKSARDRVEKNLRPDGVAAYQAARAEMDPVAINAAVQAVKPYSGDEIQLNAAEQDALFGLTKDKVPSLKNPNAKADYAAEMAPIQIVDGNAVKPSSHLEAHAIAVKYRQMLASAGVKVPGAPDVSVPASTAPVVGAPASTNTVVGGNAGPRKTSLSPDELKLLTKDERTIYDTLKTDDERADFIAAHQSDLDERAAMKEPTSVDEFAALKASQKKKFCEPILEKSNGTAAAASHVAPAKKQLIAADAGKTDGVVDGNTATGDVVAGPAKPKPGDASSFDDAAKLDACRKYATTLPRGGNITGGGPKDVPTPAGQPGTDKDNTPKEKKPDPNFYRNVANGMAFGLFGMILGSFFGGPLVMLAAAAVIGGAAYATSKHINKPKDDK
jgi:hypothetical protein